MKKDSLKFLIESIEPSIHSGMCYEVIVRYGVENCPKSLIVRVSNGLASIKKWSVGELKSVFKKIAENKISEMVESGKFEKMVIFDTDSIFLLKNWGL